MMDGRIQNELAIDKKTADKVARMPQFVNGWYLNMKASRKTAATCKDFVNKVYRFLAFINPDVKGVTLKDINESTVTQYYLSIQTKETEGGVTYTSDSYQSTVWHCLDNFLGYLYHGGLIDRNYMEIITKPKNHDLERINERRVLLTGKDFRNIIAAIDSERDEDLRKRDKALILVFMNTGIRCTALSNIMLSDINFDKKTLEVVDKGNKHHDYVLNDDMVRVLSQWVAVRSRFRTSRGMDPVDTGNLFVSEQGNRMHQDTVSNVVKKYTQRALGKSLSPHKLRAGYCSILYNKTHDIEFVRRAVGHANVATTQRYIVTAGEEKRRAAEIIESIF